jgi:hypothetical protein
MGVIVVKPIMIVKPIRNNLDDYSAGSGVRDGVECEVGLAALGGADIDLEVITARFSSRKFSP